MKKILTIVAITLLSNSLTLNELKAQGIHVFEDYGPPVISVNDHGKAVTTISYYDYNTRTFTPAESNIIRFYNINNRGDVTGSITMLENSAYEQPAYKLATDTEWQRIPWFEDSNPETSFFDIGNISPNGKYIVGMMSIGATNYGSFIFDTTTKQSIRLMDENQSVYKIIRLYGINDNGIAVGYVTKTGTNFRIPIYMSMDDQIIHEIPYTEWPYGLVDMAYDINSENVIVGRIGSDFGFRYNINDPAATTFEYIETPYFSYITNLTNISNSGIAVGYATISVSPIYQEGIILDPKKDPNKLYYIYEYLSEKGITYETPDGMAILGNVAVISDNGRYIGGYCNGNVPGWMADLGEPELATNDIPLANLSIYPNPTTDSFTVNGIKEISQITIYSMEGKVVKTFKTKQDHYNISELNTGVYLVSVKDNNGKSRIIRLVKKN